MKKVFFALGTLATLSFAGCGGKSDVETDPNLLVNNDFETIAGWLPEGPSATLSREKAHSGHYSIKVDAAHEYSLTYKAALGQLHDTRIKKINISAWTFVPMAGAKASLVVSVGNPTTPNDKPLLWDGLEVGKGNAFGKWVEISKSFTIPESASPTSVLTLYLWRTSGNQPIYLDDLRVTLEP